MAGGERAGVMSSVSHFHGFGPMEKIEASIWNPKCVEDAIFDWQIGVL